MSKYPSINDREFDLLKKLVENTADFAGGASQYLEKSENLGDLPDKQAAMTNLGVLPLAQRLIKPFELAPTPALKTTAASTIKVKAGVSVVVNSAKLVNFALDTTAALDTGALVPGTDYAVYAVADGTAVFSANFAAPPAGYTADQVQLIGGFHYAPGGNATGFNTGGGTTPAINPYSIWDLKFRPACPDPRGMALVAGSFWADIYLCNTDTDMLGTSANNAQIADGSSPPKVPTLFGGNGSTTYGSLTGFEAVELLAAHGKQPLSVQESMVAFFGAQEAKSRGSDAVKTGLGTANTGSSNADEAFTSLWGLMQATGVMNVWTRDWGFRTYTQALAGSPPADADLTTWINAAKTGSYRAITEGRGSVYTYGLSSDGTTQAISGGNWISSSFSGSRCSAGYVSPSHSGDNVGARGRSDHLCLP